MGLTEEKKESKIRPRSEVWGGGCMLLPLTEARFIEDRPTGKASICSAGVRVQSLSREDPLEKETVIHSGTLAWKSPRTEEPGRLQSMGLQRVDMTEQLHFHFQAI